MRSLHNLILKFIVAQAALFKIGLANQDVLDVSVGGFAVEESCSGDLLGEGYVSVIQK